MRAPQEGNLGRINTGRPIRRELPARPLIDKNTIDITEHINSPHGNIVVGGYIREMEMERAEKEVKKSYKKLMKKIRKYRSDPKLRS